MANVSLSEAQNLIRGYLDKVAEEAQRYMAQYIEEHAKQGYATGHLRDSIKIDKRGENVRAVGSDLEYAIYVDKGRGEVHAHNPTGLLRYYDPVAGHWIRTPKVRKMDGIGFIEATKEHIEDTYIGLS